VDVDTSGLADRPLARHFSAPLHTVVEGYPVSLRFRLFALGVDGTSYRLFHTASPRPDGSDPERTEAYLREIGGWIGNASLGLLRSGAFGTPISRGGDGSAEAHYLETAELLTRQYMRGAEWLVRTVQPRLFLDYFPLADEIDHEFFGMVDRRYPGYDPEVAARAQRVRERGWQLVDMRVGHVRRLSESMPNSAVFISGDHGMRPAWMVLRPNVALRDAGLLTLGEDGAIDLARTVALSPNGYWINVNTVDWKGGIVSFDDRDAVLDGVERALREIRGEDGEPIVTAVWRSSEHPGLGIGGPAGGDLYYELRFGYHVSHDTRGPLISTSRPEGKHGYPPMAADMRTALCVVSPAIGSRRIGAVHTIDLAPTVAEWLGFPAPQDARGRSLLRELTGEGSR
jgi:predicted AlkP superfamily phosphohydrolase/phosphomutase